MTARPLTDAERARARQAGVCGAGEPRCGQAARLYPCGWRCGAHAPGGAP